MENVKLEIDGRTVEAAEGTTVLQAARSLGISQVLVVSSVVSDRWRDDFSQVG